MIKHRRVDVFLFMQHRMGPGVSSSTQLKVGRLEVEAILRGDLSHRRDESGSRNQNQSTIFNPTLSLVLRKLSKVLTIML